MSGIVEKLGGQLINSSRIQSIRVKRRNFRSPDCNSLVDLFQTVSRRRAILGQLKSISRVQKRVPVENVNFYSHAQFRQLFGALLSLMTIVLCVDSSDAELYGKARRVSEWPEFRIVRAVFKNMKQAWVERVGRHLIKSLVVSQRLKLAEKREGREE